MSIKHRRRYAGLYVVAAAWRRTPVLFFAEARFSMPAVPFLAVFAASGVVWLAHHVSRWTGISLAPIDPSKTVEL